MNSNTTMTLKTFHPSTLSELTSFLKEALGSFFTVDSSLENETVFFGAEETVLTLKQKTNSIYQLTIESNDNDIVKGMIGYLIETMEEQFTSFPIYLSI